MLCCSNEEFVKAIEAQERDDLQTLEQKLRHPVSSDQQRRIGMSKLKAFLESLLLEKYIERLPKMMTVIQQQANEVVRSALDCSGSMLLGKIS